MTTKPVIGNFSSVGDAAWTKADGTSIGSVDATTGAWEFGASGAGNLTHIVNGVVTFRSTQTGASAIWKFQNLGASPAASRIELSTIGTTTSSSVYHRFLRGASGTTIEWDVGIVGSVNSAYSWSSAVAEVGWVTQDGTWTFGTHNDSGNHRFRGTDVTIRLDAKTNTSPAFYFQENGANKWAILNNQATDNFEWNNASGQLSGYISQAGAFTLGPSGSSATNLTVEGVASVTKQIRSSGGFGGSIIGFSSSAVDLVPAYGGLAYMVIIGGNNAGGSSTTVGVYILRAYQDNSATWASSASTVIQLVQQGVGSFTFSLNGTNIAIQGGGAGNWSAQVFGVGSF